MVRRKTKSCPRQSILADRLQKSSSLDAICFPPPGEGVAAIELCFEQGKAGVRAPSPDPTGNARPPAALSTLTSQSVAHGKHPPLAKTATPPASSPVTPKTPTPSVKKLLTGWKAIKTACKKATTSKPDDPAKMQPKRSWPPFPGGPRRPRNCYSRTRWIECRAAIDVTTCSSGRITASGGAGGAGAGSTYSSSRSFCS